MKSLSLFALLAAVGFLLVFILVWTGAIAQTDDAIFVSINALSANPTFGMASGYITALGSEIVLALIGILYYLTNRRENTQILLGVFFAIAITDLVLALLKGAYFRPRPYQVYSNVILPIGQDEGSSFPSGHATRAFAVMAFISLQKGKRYAPLFLVSVAVAISRVAVGVHFPSDVLAGAFLGLILAMVSFEFLKKFVFPRVPHTVHWGRIG